MLFSFCIPKLYPKQCTVYMHRSEPKAITVIDNAFKPVHYWVPYSLEDGATVVSTEKPEQFGAAVMDAFWQFERVPMKRGQRRDRLPVPQDAALKASKLRSEKQFKLNYIGMTITGVTKTNIILKFETDEFLTTAHLRMGCSNTKPKQVGETLIAFRTMFLKCEPFIA